MIKLYITTIHWFEYKNVFFNISECYSVGFCEKLVFFFYNFVFFFEFNIRKSRRASTSIQIPLKT